MKKITLALFLSLGLQTYTWAAPITCQGQVETSAIQITTDLEAFDYEKNSGTAEFTFNGKIYDVNIRALIDGFGIGSPGMDLGVTEELSTLDEPLKTFFKSFQYINIYAYDLGDPLPNPTAHVFFGEKAYELKCNF